MPRGYRCFLQQAKLSPVRLSSFVYRFSLVIERNQEINLKLGSFLCQHAPDSNCISLKHQGPFTIGASSTLLNSAAHARNLVLQRIECGRMSVRPNGWPNTARHWATAMLSFSKVICRGCAHLCQARLVAIAVRPSSLRLNGPESSRRLPAHE